MYDLELFVGGAGTGEAQPLLFGGEVSGGKETGPEKFHFQGGGDLLEGYLY